MDSTRECAGIRSQLGVYVVGAISPEDRAVVVRHLAACEPCREELAGLAVLPGLLRRSSAPRDQPAGGEPPLAGAALLGQALGGLARRRRRRRWVLGGAAGLLAAAAVAGWVTHPAGTAASGRPAAGWQEAVTVLETEKVGPATVLTDAEGYTLYWFSSDTTTASGCTGSCAAVWPPVAGPAIAGDGVTGRLGAITRPDGSLQATYDGHPLYTASKDLAPGQARGNGVRAGDGVWHEAVVSAGPGHGPGGS